MARASSLPAPLPGASHRRAVSAAAVALGVALGLGVGCQRGEKGRLQTRKAVKALEEKGAACFAEGRYDCAMDAYAAAAKKQPRRSDLWNRFSQAARLRYYVTGEADYRDQELDALRRAAKLDTRSTVVQVNLGTVCWEMGLRGEAAQAYRIALRLAPGHPDAALMRARILRSAGEDEPEEGASKPGP